MRQVLIWLMLTFTIIGCATNFNKMVEPEFNWKEFTGLVSGKVDRYEDAVLDYGLDTMENGALHFRNCPQVEQTNEETIVESQYYFFKLLLRNCKALKLYCQEGQRARTSYFQKALTKDDIRQWPAVAGPVMNDEDMSRRQGKTLAAYETAFDVSIQGQNAIKLTTGTDHIMYYIMARYDFNQDGIEDLLVRMSWHVRDAFGKGTDLFILEKTSPTSPITLTWRF
ncbi:MAG: hypothetical protein KJP07_03705 [Desulfatitalea sp.]|nr:hypothetical protein [Desulfatitalea sp.]